MTWLRFEMLPGLLRALRSEAPFQGLSRCGGIDTRPDHLDQPLEMVGMDKTYDSLGCAPDGFHVPQLAGTLGNLNAFIFVCTQVKLPVTDRTSKA